MIEKTPPPSDGHENTTLPRSPVARMFLRWWIRHMRDLDREATLMQVNQEGGLTYSFLFLVIASCGIATLGLMLNSAAVIIGAMLVAPLMGPIVLLGFSIAATDVEQAKRSALALLVGIAGALAISYAIVKLSPYIPPTPEILARTNPNLFDLLVAILSGMVAGYAVSHSKIGTVAGVAIATALMPPLAAAGYGLATGEMRIFNGAFFLFLTNMLAIAFSVAGMAAWYGFGNLRTPRNLVWQTGVALVMLVVLSIPLVRTLNDSVRKSLTAKVVEEILRSEMHLEGSQLDKLAIKSDAGGTLRVEAVVFTPEYDKTAQTRLTPTLSKQLGQPVHLKLDQVIIGDAMAQLENQQALIASQVLADKLATPQDLEAGFLSRLFKEALPVPVLVSEVNPTTKTARVQVAQTYAADLSALYTYEHALQQHFPAWQIQFIPPIRPLPDIVFESGKSKLAPSGTSALATAIWALKRWEATSTRVMGLAASGELGKKTANLANQRAALIAERLRQAGIEAQTETDYPRPQQAQLEKARGLNAFRIAQIEPVFEPAQSAISPPNSP